MKLALAVVLCCSAVFSVGCSRSSSDFTPGGELAKVDQSAILITTNDITDRPYERLGVVKATAKKATAFNSDPTTNDVNRALEREAKAVGADAIINVQYKGGVAWDSWGAMTGEGVAIKFKDAPAK